MQDTPIYPAYLPDTVSPFQRLQITVQAPRGLQQVTGDGNPMQRLQNLKQTFKQTFLAGDPLKLTPEQGRYLTWMALSFGTGVSDIRPVRPRYRGYDEFSGEQAT